MIILKGLPVTTFYQNFSDIFFYSEKKINIKLRRKNSEANEKGFKKMYIKTWIFQLYRNTVKIDLGLTKVCFIEGNV